MSEPTPLEKRIAAAVNAESHPDMDDVAMLLGVLASQRDRAQQAEKEAERLRQQREEDVETVRVAIEAREKAEREREGTRVGLCEALGVSDTKPWAALLERVRRVVEERCAADRERNEAAMLYEAEKVARERAEADSAREREAHALTAKGWETEARKWSEERAGLLERVRALEAVLEQFQAAEWVRGDWQGLCPFRRHKDIVCLGTDGRVSAVGTPTPVPHSAHCPYHHLNTLKERKP